MKVSISYTVNFDDVPEEINKLSQRAENNLHLLQEGADFEKLREAVSGSNFDAALELMHKIRTTLADIDTCLSDCNQILEGYLKAKYSQEEVPASAPPATMQSQPRVAPEGFDMEKELANLKKENPNLFPKSTSEEQ